MAKILNDVSRTFNEFLLLPNLTDERCVPDNVSLWTPLVKYNRGESPTLSANLPMVSAIMQSVSGEKMAISLAREGGIAFIYGAQSINDQAAMIANVKKYKAGFIISDSNVTENTTIGELINLVEKTGHSTVMVTENGLPTGKFIGMLTDKDYRLSRVSMDDKISD